MGQLDVPFFYCFGMNLWHKKTVQPFFVAQPQVIEQIFCSIKVSLWHIKVTA